MLVVLQQRFPQHLPVWCQHLKYFKPCARTGCTHTSLGLPRVMAKTMSQCVDMYYVSSFLWVLSLLVSLFYCFKLHLLFSQIMSTLCFIIFLVIVWYVFCPFTHRTYFGGGHDGDGGGDDVK